MLLRQLVHEKTNWCDIYHAYLAVKWDFSRSLISIKFLFIE